MVGKKIILVILDLLKSICCRKLKGFFYTYHFGISFDQKTWFEKPRILIVVVKVQQKNCTMMRSQVPS
jgi:hypothetical protein